MKKTGTARRDRAYVWHPFTPFDRWLSEDYPMVSIARGQGCWLEDEDGNRYLDGNSSIWVNLHGHRHPAINRAIKRQLDRIAHSSFLGLTNDQAPALAERLIQAANRNAPGGLGRVFFSDDGSTAIEAAVKIVYQHNVLTKRPGRRVFVSLRGGYHGDTVGAMSVGQSELFHGAYRPLLFPAEHAMSPACYRCPYNRAQPERADARSYRKCRWECVGEFRQAVRRAGSQFAGAVLEPSVQGAAGMIMHPEGYLARVAEIVTRAKGKLILDEVMTGFHRTGPLFAFHRESVRSDVVALAKGLTGGYLPLAATLVTEDLVEPFKGGLEKTFYHGHSYTGNQLGCAAAHASLDLLQKRAFLPALEARTRQMHTLGQTFWSHPHVGDVRREGLILAIELVEDWKTRRGFDPKRRIGWQICEAARRHGLLTRSIGDVLLLMPPLSVKASELTRMAGALRAALEEILPARPTNS